MNKAKSLYSLTLAGLLSLPVAVNARTINLFETEDGKQAVPGNANPKAVENAAFAEFASMTIEDIINTEINGKPLTVLLHVPDEGNGKGYDVVRFSQEYPEGISPPGMTKPDVSPVPLPAAAWLMASGLMGITLVARRRNPSGR
ncbi:MAG: VPLPA-CTERM sorting domain-containing protein [Guyparkeria sp.]